MSMNISVKDLHFYILQWLYLIFRAKGKITKHWLAEANGIFDDFGFPGARLFDPDPGGGVLRYAYVTL